MLGEPKIGIRRLQIGHGEIAVRGKFGEPGFGCFDIGPVDFIGFLHARRPLLHGKGLP
jgi:hypothetical protein